MISTVGTLHRDPVFVRKTDPVFHFKIDLRFSFYNRDPILIAEPDPGSSGKIDPWMFSTEQNFFLNCDPAASSERF